MKNGMESVGGATTCATPVPIIDPTQLSPGVSKLGSMHSCVSGSSTTEEVKKKEQGAARNEDLKKMEEARKKETQMRECLTFLHQGEELMREVEAKRKDERGR